MWLERLSGGGVDLVSLGSAKDHLRIIGNETDAEVEAAISAASVHLDVDADGFGGLGFPIVAQQWSSKAAGFTPRLLRLPFSRVTEVTEIRYIAPDGTPGTVPSADYLLIRRGRDALVELLPGKAWPNLIDRPDAVDLRFTAGFPDLVSVPDDIIQAAKELITYYFFSRGGDGPDGISEEVARCVDRLTRRYRRFAA
ncbi:MAG: hypothetical protein H5U19_07795 [Rhodobacteraceae bacterium]|nr:hypothetical protein [Paracoccaceae bacterium]